MKILFFILTFCLCPAALWSQGHGNDQAGTLTAVLDRDSAQVGSIVTLTLNYQLPDGAVIPDDPEIKGIDELSTMDLKTGPDVTTITFLVDRLDSCDIGPVSLAYFDRKGRLQRLTADPVSLNVLSNLGEDPDEAQPKSIMEIIPDKSSRLEYLSMMGLVLLVAYASWWMQRRHNLKKPGRPADPPHVLAKNEVEKLEAQGLFENGEIKAFYFRFSEILRRYMESIRGFPASESTTEEIFLRINNEQDQGLIALLRHVDLVKFADTVPTLSGKSTDINSLLSYIQETSPVTETNSPVKSSMEEAP